MSVSIFSTIDDQEVNYFVFFIQFFRERVNIIWKHVLVLAIEKKIVLAGDACFRPPIIIKSLDLHASDIRGTMDEIASYHERV